MLVKDLIPRVRSIYGDEESPYLISDNVLRDNKIPSGIDRFNLEFPKQFIITGTADNAIISIEPRAEEITLICLYAALAIFDGEIAKNAQHALSPRDLRRRDSGQLTHAKQGLIRYVTVVRLDGLQE